MAVYTRVSAEALAEFLQGFDVGEVAAFKGIAEGVENSNYLVDTTHSRYFLTLYEKRVAEGDLPFFMALLDHLASRGCAVPPAIPDRDGRVIHRLAGRPACLIAFLPGVSPSTPTPEQARAAGAALAGLHLAAADLPQRRANGLGPDGWRALMVRCGDELRRIDPQLATEVGAAVADVLARWPRNLPEGVIHADLFPDNVLMLGDRVSGLIDFYFACTDLLAYDLALTHTAWAFRDGAYQPDVGRALVAGYEAVRPLRDDERAALPLLARGACLRFTLTRAWDWLNTPADAVVTRKDPLDYWRRYLAYTCEDRFS